MICFFDSFLKTRKRGRGAGSFFLFFRSFHSRLSPLLLLLPLPPPRQFQEHEAFLISKVSSINNPFFHLFKFFVLILIFYEEDVLNPQDTRNCLILFSCYCTLICVDDRTCFCFRIVFELNWIFVIWKCWWIMWLISAQKSWSSKHFAVIHLLYGELCRLYQFLFSHCVRLDFLFVILEMLMVLWLISAQKWWSRNFVCGDSFVV